MNDIIELRDSSLSITTLGVSKRMELIFSEPNVYGNWTPLDFAFHFEGMSFREKVEFLDDIINEGSDWITE